MLKFLFLKKIVEGKSTKGVLAFVIAASVIPSLVAIIIGVVFFFEARADVAKKQQEGYDRIVEAREDSSFVKNAAQGIIGESWQKVYGFNPFEETTSDTSEPFVFEP